MQAKRFRVSEIFGPTIQGEGRRIGTPCYFVRFGGCDYRCTWCDTPFAVLPEEVAKLPQLSEHDIMSELAKLPSKPRWVVLSGGNPALLDLKVLLAELFSAGYSTMVETQGTVWKPWLPMVDDLCISPKPPSSGNETTPAVLHEFFRQHWANLYNPYTQCYLKIVVFDDQDYEYARRMHKEFDNLQMFVSVGNEDPSLPTVGNPDPDPAPYQTRDVVLNKMRWLMEKVSNDLSMREVRVTPQMHVLAWGNERGR